MNREHVTNAYKKFFLRFCSITNVMAIRTHLIPDSTSSVNLIHSRCPEPCATFVYLLYLYCLTVEEHGATLYTSVGVVC